jgi:MFS family permease
MVPMFLAAVDQTLLATATPVISRELGGLRDTSWLAVAYLLASVIMVPLYGRLGDRFGRRKVLSVAIVVFALGSLACGLAPTLGLLVAARALQGVGGGGLMTLSQALIGEVVAPRLRARNQSYFAIIFTLASVGGPVIGGLVVHHASWRWLFIVNLPLCALAVWRCARCSATIACILRAASPMRPASSCSRSPRRPASCGCRRPGHRFAWASATSIVCWRRRSRSASPWSASSAVPRDPSCRSSCSPCAGALRGADGHRFASAMFAMVFYLPVYLQLALHSNPAESGCCCCR